MKIFRNLMSQTLELEEANRTALKQTAMFDCNDSNYMLALAVMGAGDPNIQKKKNLFKKLYKAENFEEQRRLIEKIWYLKYKQDEKILEAFAFIEKQKEQNKNMFMGRLWRPFTIGVRSFEFEAEE